MSKKFSYDKAMQELNSIISQLQNEEVGLDQLGDLIKKANTLIEHCKEKLKEIDHEINQLHEKGADNLNVNP